MYNFKTASKLADTYYCTIYNPRTYTWNWANREQLNKIPGESGWTSKDADGNYINSILPYKKEIVFGSSLTVDLKYIYGTSANDGQYDGSLTSSYNSSLTLKEAYLYTKGTENSEYYSASSISSGQITLSPLSTEQSMRSDIPCDLVIICEDMYGNEVKVSVDFTIKKR